MSKLYASRIRLGLVLTALAVTAVACTALGKNETFFGKVDPPQANVLHYVSGTEPESLDTQVGSASDTIRIYMALFEGLVEYDPKNTGPIPAIADHWETNADSSEFVFHLRPNARWSNGETITAQDFAYSFRRALSPELASRNAYLGYYIKYAQAYNTGGSFVRDSQKQFLLKKDFLPPRAPKASPDAETSGAAAAAPATASAAAAQSQISDSVNGTPAVGEDLSLDTEFHHLMHAPERVVLPGDKDEREALFKANPKLKEAVQGKEEVPVTANDIGVEPVNDTTLRLTLSQSAPFFIKLLPHSFFHVVPHKAIEAYKDEWTQPGHMVASGPFMLKEWKPYDKIVVERNPYYWDAANVKLDGIVFYPVTEAVTIMNLYKAGEIDAFGNHNVPLSWLDKIQPLKDYMGATEAGNDYWDFNCKKKPTDNKWVRKALNMAINKADYAQWRKIVKPLYTFVPGEIFPDYPAPKGDEFDPVKARQFLVKAGYHDDKGNYDPKKFPVSEVEITYNPGGSNEQISEYIQAQWKQNLQLTIPLRAMEWRSFVAARPKLEYKGLARDAWGADYMDPFTFLNLFVTGGENGCGWSSPTYDAMLEEANRTLDPQKRNELLAKAEAFMLDEQPIMPMATTATNWMKKPYVKGMYPNPGSLHAWKFISIERDRSKWDYGVPDMTKQ